MEVATLQLHASATHRSPRGSRTCLRHRHRCRIQRSNSANDDAVNLVTYDVSMGIVERLIYRRQSRIARSCLIALFGIDFPSAVRVGKALQMPHHGMGTVIHPRTTIGDRVKIYHQVTIGRKDAHIPIEQSKMTGIEIGDEVVLFPGAKVLGGTGVTVIGSGTMVAANAVLMNSTGPNEIWAGIPAKLIGTRS